jgi:hypothetical protein
MLTSLTNKNPTCDEAGQTHFSCHVKRLKNRLSCDNKGGEVKKNEDASIGLIHFKNMQKRDNIL